MTGGGTKNKQLALKQPITVGQSISQSIGWLSSSLGGTPAFEGLYDDAYFGLLHKPRSSFYLNIYIFLKIHTHINYN